jgi:hypothetical protein
MTDPFDTYMAARLGKPAEVVTAALDADEAGDRVGEIVAALNDYEGAHTSETGDHNIWQDVIIPLPEYDEALTDVYDTGQNDRFAVSGTSIGRDAHVIAYDYERACWYDSLVLN